jgi:cobalt-zinc-cadmium efflux system protein
VRGHDHGSEPSPRQPGTGTRAQRRALYVALALNGVFLVAEVVGGVVFGSLALLADAGHMLTDVGAIALSIFAFHLAERPASQAHSYGLQRAELLAALANGVSLLVISGWVVFEAIRRFGDPPEVAGVGLLAVAAGGLVVNLASAAVLGRTREGNVNVRGAFLHLLSDALGSVAAVVAGVAVILSAPGWVDPLASLVIVALIAVSGIGLLREVTHVLMEGTPPGLEPEAIASALHDESAVDRVHHVHVWRLSSESVALSGHVVAEGVDQLHDAQLLADRLKTVLSERFGVDHATLELECHDCRTRQLVRPGEVAPETTAGGDRDTTDTAQDTTSEKI